MRRDLIYAKMLEGLESQTCPICYLAAGAVRHWLEHLLYEMVNDPGVRKRIRDSRGLCSTHAHVLAGFGDPLGHAIIYGDLIRAVLEDVSPEHGLGGLTRELVAPPGTRRSCPACGIQEDTENTYCRFLIDGLKSDGLRAEFERSHGLCLPHFKQVMEFAGDPAGRRFLALAQRAKLELLRDDLDQLVRSHDYRFSGEATQKVGGSWRQAVRKMVGDEALVIG